MKKVGIGCARFALVLASGLSASVSAESSPGDLQQYVTKLKAEGTSWKSERGNFGLVIPAARQLHSTTQSKKSKWSIQAILPP
jgi:hypothetical protein